MKLLSVNVEKRNHVELIKNLITKTDAEVVCLEEVCSDDLDLLLEKYPFRLFGPNFRLVDGKEVGVVIAAKCNIQGRLWYSDGNASREVPLEALGAHRPILILAEVSGMTLGVVHFTWTREMSESDKQAKDLTRLLDYLGDRELILLGDFNIPRGNTTYQRLANKYLDNIPLDIVSTIDFDMHRAKREGKNRFEAVVDYIWSTRAYKVTNVQVISGVSDHCAIVCDIAKS